MDLKEFGQELAKIGLPLLGAALPVPGGAAIGTALAAAIGSTGKPEDVLTRLTESADAVEKAKQFELTHQETMLKLTTEAALNEYRGEIDDRASARNRETSVKDNTNRILAFVVVGSFIALVAGTMLGWAKVDSVLAGTLVGYLSAKCEQVLAYYFGSTKSSERKTELLSQAPAIPAKTAK
jgi:xanthine/uracil permease